MLRAAVDAGITFFDTSDLYSQGQSEIVLGRALAPRRSEVTIATKGGYIVPEERRLLARVKPYVRPLVRRLPVRPAGPGSAGMAPMPQDFTPAYLATAVDASLKRLRTDHIDLYQLHSPPRTIVGAERVRRRARGAEGRWQDPPLRPGRGRGGRRQRVRPSSCRRLPAGPLQPAPSRRGGSACFPCLARPMWLSSPARVTPPACSGTGWRRWSCKPSHRTGQRSSSSTGAVDEIGRPLMEAALQFSLAPREVAVTILGMRTRAHLAANLRNYSAPPLTPSEIATLTDGARGQ